MDRSQLRQPTTWLQISAYRFLLRRLECALLGRDIHATNVPPPARTASLAVGCAVVAVALLGCALPGLLRPHPDLGRARIVMGERTGALYVRVGDAWHPVLNLASARYQSGALPERCQRRSVGPGHHAGWLRHAQSRWNCADLGCHPVI